MALGANRPTIIRLVLRGTFLIGLSLGLPMAFGAGRLISAQLYGVSAWDPAALGIATAALAFSSFLAAIVPGTRASFISPMQAFRVE